MSSSKFATIAAIVLFTTATAYSQKPPSQAGNLIQLSLDQKSRLAKIKVDAEKTGAPVALHFAEITKKIYENMLSDVPDEQLRVLLSEQMKSDAATLLVIKGEAIRASVGVLSPEQKATLRSEMRKPGAPADLTELIEKLFDH